MKILFVMRHAGYVRNFEWTLRLLAERGHRVHVAFDERPRAWMLEPAGILQALVEEHPKLSHGLAPGRDMDGWASLARRLRLALDYLRYLEPRYRDASKLRARAKRRAPRIVRRVAGWPIVRTRFGRATLGRALGAAERATRGGRAIAEFLREYRPDIMLLTPLVELGSPQTEYVRAAKALGVRTGLCVASWDNLTNKGLIRDVPDLSLVWNEAMKREAVELHGVAADRVVVTGAVPYDHWFEWKPSRSREVFCERVGLRPDRPFVLYLCSSPFIAPREAGFVEAWIRQLRERGGPAVRDAGVLVRPHPINAAQWRDVDLSEPGRVAVWPREGADPVDAQSRADYYDSIYHSAAVVGVNTSAQIESAIVGRPVYTLLAPEFRETQAGTLHFHHLARPEGGLLRAAATFEEHAAQLAEALAAEGRSDERARRFVEAFVRPHGLGVAATPKLVEAIEAACVAPAPRPQPRPRWAALPQLLLAPLVYGERLRRRRAYLDGARRRARPLLRRLRRRAKRPLRRTKLILRHAKFPLRRAKRGLRRAKLILRRVNLLMRRVKPLVGRVKPLRRRAKAVLKPMKPLLKRATLVAIRRTLKIGPMRRFAGRRVLPTLDAATGNRGGGHVPILRYAAGKLALELARARPMGRVGAAMSERPAALGTPDPVETPREDSNGADRAPSRRLSGLRG